MNGFQWIMAGLTGVYAVVTPIVLTKAILRKEKQRVFKLIVSLLFVAYWMTLSLAPAVIEKVFPTLRWVLLPVVLLFVANMFGFSDWLFKQHKKKTMP